MDMVAAENDLQAIVAERIRDRRRELGITQEVLAEAIGTSQSHLARLERGHKSPGLAMLHALARALQTTPNFLMDFD